MNAKSDAAARALTTLLDFEAVTAPLEKGALEKLMRGEGHVTAVSLESPPAESMGWTPMTTARPTVLGTYVVRIVWKTPTLQLLQRSQEGPSDAHWARVTHWYGPLPLPDV